ncbi:LLM class F420-dependent oxidoreductase [Pseudonocardia sp. WMMC193]|uniref:LLM class F420-dependent oxidoreductase n=1 Tax=Pseudonocardia sp. WMMC193 TaxID=2911965 RepID=UPI001F38B3F8|nr:LLM class F420-dependent oxidoreductase [Pseudonocardia sp. WMMC193]MCF7549465.1 LLM class F420-dependent oxidoreductase [Pseudonocardia sp. WMMC193]
MRFGVFAVSQVGGGEPEAAVASVRLAEELGFESLWLNDHVVVPSRYDSVYPYDESGKMGGDDVVDFPDPLIWLSFAAAVTSRIRLATGVLVLPQRNPVVLAKQVATLDRLSGGRVVLGVGTGWLAEEFAAVGVDFAGRGRRHDDYLAAMRQLWTGEPASVDRDTVSFSGVVSVPTPAQSRVPIVVGGGGPRAIRRAAQLGDGLFPAALPAGEVAKTARLLREETERAGRPAGSVGLTVIDGAQDLDEFSRLVEQHGAAGVERILIPVRPEKELRTFAEAMSARFGMTA